jgi:hypothetical protein
MIFFAQLITWINVPVNFLGKFLFAFIAVMPGWLSNTIISAVVGVLAMFIFKYTSNQSAISKAKDLMKANMLALKLFKDSFTVTMSALGQIYKGVFIRLFHLLRPVLIMTVPFVLVMLQMGLWYQFRPLQPGEEAVVTMQLDGDVNSPWPQVSMESTPAAEVVIEQTKAFSKRQLYWKIRAKENGLHDLIFNVGSEKVEKELAIGSSLMKVSAQRPGMHFEDILLNPWEKPFTKDSVVQSIGIQYPERSITFFGIPMWMIFFFIVSMVVGGIFMPFLKVKI